MSFPTALPLSCQFFLLLLPPLPPRLVCFPSSSRRFITPLRASSLAFLASVRPLSLLPFFFYSRVLSPPLASCLLFSLPSAHFLWCLIFASYDRSLLLLPRRFPAFRAGVPFTTSSAFLAALLPACSFAFLTALLDRLSSCSPCLGFLVLRMPALLNFPLITSPSFLPQK